ncbi:hypothetical protein [Paenibacillus sacheonensis]|uniref:Phage protein n=1 Tax=Paenibacillus sacheonensis TaxID=742054 RepID=A0A7X4YTY0_9BACL|nr:hypothetical protein [Paenibacillus sacheonensis]MBM7568601.1 hypothetical protein [Paenibacillus sacheonensis]NBC72503.1 hypothetical protein [Paenibacillus sacheonensis]
MKVYLIEKSADGTLIPIDEREWDTVMITALEHVNYLSVNNQEYQTIEGKLNVDSGSLELLVVKMNKDH